MAAKTSFWSSFQYLFVYLYLAVFVLIAALYYRPNDEGIKHFWHFSTEGLIGPDRLCIFLLTTINLAT